MTKAIVFDDVRMRYRIHRIATIEPESPEQGVVAVNHGGRSTPRLPLDSVTAA